MSLTHDVVFGFISLTRITDKTKEKQCERAWRRELLCSAPCRVVVPDVYQYLFPPFLLRLVTFAMEAAGTSAGVLGCSHCGG